ncbi:hypothetical protein [Parasphingopyxis marina]|uniref:DUF2946 domain-containing protein n=1 Tax=Parasphingopyxis marina TaxID=2761622 RepID=A0A842HU20_9SPHN|nr:hypothetical protein [Parasphingopyxis marina]MBC2777448.1 hypothetical protein [Parasphingopyxis marina]
MLKPLLFLAMVIGLVAPSIAMADCSPAPETATHAMAMDQGDGEPRHEMPCHDAPDQPHPMVASCIGCSVPPVSIDYAPPAASLMAAPLPSLPAARGGLGPIPDTPPPRIPA